MIVCAGRNETFDFAKPIGVGLIETASTLTRIILEENPSQLYFIGSAGSYGNYQLFDIIHSYQTTNIELGFLMEECYTPLVNSLQSMPIYVPRETLKNNSIVNSSNYITCSASLSKKMLLKGIELENMEFFSVVSVANTFNIPCSGLFVITNFCHENAHHEFLENHAKAKSLLYEYIKKQKFEDL